MKKLTRTQIESKLNDNPHFNTEWFPSAGVLRIYGSTMNSHRLCGIDMPYLMELVAGHVWTIQAENGKPYIMVEF